MSIRSDRKDTTPNAATVLQDAATADAALSEGNSFTTSTPENPLNRELVVSIRASLNQLCLQKNKGTWAPTGSALKQIFQQRKFVSLDGSADQQGDLKAVVLHNLSVNAAKSTFPICKCHARPYANMLPGSHILCLPFPVPCVSLV
tara:strand:+ start:2936 stop:3373 length:438 start_codon:yes stop_codon:yes gene_type:complete